MAEQILNVSGLSVSAGEKAILHGIDLSVGAGETHVLVGPNGAGKSTLGSALMGDARFTVTAGSINFAGNDITDATPDARARAGMFLSFQTPLEVPGLTLASFIRACVQQRTGKPLKFFTFRKEMAAAMDRLEMSQSYADRDLNVGFSGGERKKAEILQLLMLKPSFAILDETDSGLDVDAVRIVSSAVSEYQKSSGASLLVITHNTKILDSIHVDRTHIMVKGRLAASGGADLLREVSESGFEKYEGAPDCAAQEEA